MASFQRVFPVNGADGNENTGVQNGDLSYSMIQSNMDDIPPFSDGGNDLCHFTEGHGLVGFVFQFGDLM
jgi:hypothetical protein